ncbi:hypothetical protein KQH42_22935 [Streptomyces sp. CHA1]|uniref:hypothetical protein n=1 Tax=unclassified Streptomyces TaxID=2593676 RepID=UPI001BFC8144|nr:MULTISPECIES: hypothetical protein [unclassified Streptomyces]MBT3160487.1 hypothetical protein [Streptomyces sp. G11C]MCO6703262.1 hypothetical protein [Streptomyces sp. CHB9.2]MCO6709623.1 hypothetical protein [Streptomyces sp. CHA3]MCO6715368.1 hypothetical protein [Streptomyces sp. CHB19.2]MCO6721493.1 hypothetical protein [Streptomyces sp. Vc714c-19]
MSGCGKVKAWQVPLRLVTGAFILHSGMEKWEGPDEQAQGVHGMARQTFPFLENIDAPRFLKLLAAGEIALGAALLTPMVPSRLAGAALTGFAGSLMAVYAQTPGLRKEGSVWPTPDGIGVSKDSWLLAIGLALTLSPHQKPHKHIKHIKHIKQAKQVAKEAKEARRLAKGLSQDGHSHHHSHRHGPGHARKGCPAHH